MKHVIKTTPLFSFVKENKLLFCNVLCVCVCEREYIMCLTPSYTTESPEKFKHSVFDLTSPRMYPIIHWKLTRNSFFTTLLFYLRLVHLLRNYVLCYIRTESKRRKKNTRIKKETLFFF